MKKMNENVESKVIVAISRGENGIGERLQRGSFIIEEEIIEQTSLRCKTGTNFERMTIFWTNPTIFQRPQVLVLF